MEESKENQPGSPLVPEEPKQELSLLLPVTHDKCPVCGSARRLGQVKVDEFKKAGILPQAWPYKGMTLQAPLVDQAHPPKIIGAMVTVKVMIMVFDVCAEPECGCLYCTEFNVVDTPAQIQQQPVSPQRPGFRNFPGGNFKHN